MTRIGSQDQGPDSNRALGLDEVPKAATRHDVEVTVDYLPATEPFHRTYPQEAALDTVRMDAMVFFGVRDRQERDRYEYFLEFQGSRVTDTSQTLQQLIGPHGRGAEFHLVEQITPGSLVA